MYVSFSKLLRIAIGLFLIALTSAASTNAGLVAHWNFDEASGSTVSDVSGNGFDGTIHGAARVEGLHSDGALDFDGFDNFVTVATTPGDLLDFAGMTEATAMAWVKANSVPGGTCCGQIAGRRDAGQTWVLRDDRRDFGAEFELLTSTNAGVVGDATADGVPRTPLGEWHHIAAVIDLSLNGGEASLYVDGVLTDSFNVPGTVLQNDSFNSPTRIDIGGASDGYFNGQIDDVRIYDTALSQPEIAAAMTTVAEPGSASFVCFFFAGIAHCFRKRRRR